jgi:putative hydrolase of the HAD superfamily
MTRRYTHLFFDLDHTLWDFEANAARVLEMLWEEHRLAERCGECYDAFKTSFDGHNERLWEKFRKGDLSREDLRWKRFWLALLDMKAPDETLSRQMGERFLEHLPLQKALVPGAEAVLQHCAAKGYDVHLITNGFETTQWQKLRTAGIDTHFGHVITSEGCGCMKPHRGIFDHALNLCGVEAKDSLMIGDALEVDIKGARDAGWDQVYYNPTGLPHKEKPTFEIRRLEELLEIV